MVDKRNELKAWSLHKAMLSIKLNSMKQGGTLYEEIIYRCYYVMYIDIVNRL